jgi:hypothetical protein
LKIHESARSGNDAGHRSHQRYLERFKFVTRGVYGERCVSGHPPLADPPPGRAQAERDEEERAHRHTTAPPLGTSRRLEMKSPPAPARRRLERTRLVI